MPLALGTSNFPFNGGGNINQTIPVGGAGTVRFKLWGGGGASACQTVSFPVAVRPTQQGGLGGGGGFVDVTFSVQAGDSIDILVASGGQWNLSNGGNGSGNGGWGGFENKNPTARTGQLFSRESGFGGPYTNNNSRAGSGGGGCTYVKLNGTIILVAGGGGGGHWGTSTDTYSQGGEGGGLTGFGGVGTGASVPGDGGTQVAGGTGGAAGREGFAMWGGKGSAAVYANGTGSTNAGGGGGAGWFGGGGGFSVVNQSAPGGGGSSYINTAHARYISTQANTRASTFNGAGLADPNYADDHASYTINAAVACGGTNRVTGSVNGGNGRAVLIYALSAPVNVNVGVGTITMTNPVFGVKVGIPEGPVGEITPLTAPDATSTGAANYDADAMPIVGMFMELGGQGIAEAIVTIQVADDPLVLTAPEGHVEIPADVQKGIATISFVQPGPNGVGRVATTTPVDIAELILSAPIALAESGVESFMPLPGPITLESPIHAVEAGFTKSIALPGPIVLGSLRPAGMAQSGPDVIGMIIPPITLTPLDAFAEPGVLVVGDLYGATILMLPSRPAGIAGLAGLATTPGVPPFYDYFARVHGLTAPVGIAGATGPATANFDSVVNLTPPIVLVEEIVSAVGQVFSDIVLTAPMGIENAVNAFSAPYANNIILSAPLGIENAVNAFGLVSATDIVLSAPFGMKEDVVNAYGDFQDGSSMIMMYLDPAFGYTFAHTGATVDGTDTLEPVLLTAPMATGGGGKNAIMEPFENGYIQLLVPDNVTKFTVKLFVTILPAKITLVSPQGFATEGLDQLGIGDFGDAQIVVSPPSLRPFITPNAYWPPIEIDTVDGFVGPGGPLRFKRSITAGAVPTLHDREIAFNENDGILFTRDSLGNIRKTPYLGFAKGRFAPDGGTDGQVLGVDGVWKTPVVTLDLPIRPNPEGGERVFASDASIGADTVSPANDTVYYHPFFLPKPTDITALAIDVVGGDIGTTAWMGVCEWDVDGTPGATEVSGSVNTGAGGVLTLAATQTLAAGWHAAMFAVTGVTGTQYKALEGVTSLAADFTISGDPTAPFVTNLTTPPTPTANATVSWAILQLVTA